MDAMTDTEPDSPCIKVCVVDVQTGHCIGCGRSTGEISSWPGLSGAEKAKIVAELPARLCDMTAKRRRRGGRRSRHGG